MVGFTPKMKNVRENIVFSKVKWMGTHMCVTGRWPCFEEFQKKKQEIKEYTI